MSFSGTRRVAGGGPDTGGTQDGADVERHRPLVLMVEDDAHDLELYGTILCYNGFDVMYARRGESALRLAQQHGPDLVLLDMSLPDMSGVEVCKTLRHDHRTRDVPVIALSGFLESSMGPRAKAAGCTVYVEKPTQPVHVLTRIESLIGRPPQAGVGRPPQVLDPEAPEM